MRQEPVAYENQLAGQRRKVGPSQPRGVRGTRPGYRGVEGFRSRKAGGWGLAGTLIGGGVRRPTAGGYM